MTADSVLVITVNKGPGYGRGLFAFLQGFLREAAGAAQRRLTSILWFSALEE